MKYKSENDCISENDRIRIADAVKRSSQVRAWLPRASWWLLIRILNGFLVLQGRTGVMLLESIAPVVAAVRALETQDDVLQSFPITAAEENARKLKDKDAEKSPNFKSRQGVGVEVRKVYGVNNESKSQQSPLQQKQRKSQKSSQQLSSPASSTHSTQSVQT